MGTSADMAGAPGSNGCAGMIQPSRVGPHPPKMVNGTDNPERDSLTEADLLKRVTDRYKDPAVDIIASYRKEYPKESLRVMGCHLGRRNATERHHAGGTQSGPGRRAGLHVSVRLADTHAGQT
jgi:hypothetical protein